MNDRLIEERTEARAELFQAQERVRELEEIVLLAAGTPGARRVIYEEAERIATKRREGK